MHPNAGILYTEPGMERFNLLNPEKFASKIYRKGCIPSVLGSMRAEVSHLLVLSVWFAFVALLGSQVVCGQVVPAGAETRIGRSLGVVRGDSSTDRTSGVASDIGLQGQKEPQAIRTVPQPLGPETLETTEKTRLKESEFDSENWLQRAEVWMGPKGISQSVQTLLFLTLLSAAPAALLMTTCYVRVVIVLGILKQALGNSQLPPTQVMGGLSLFITLAVMSPVWKQVYDEAIEPYTVAGSQMGALDAWEKGVAPIRHFMSQQIAMAGNYDDVHLFYQRYAPGQSSPDNFESVPLVVLLPAYMLSELKTAFLMGFQIYLPFLVLDLVIAAVTTALGLSQLSPAAIAIPFKLLLFVLVDGWRLVVQMLLDSFGSFVPI